MPIPRTEKPKPHHRPRALRVLDPAWRDNLPAFVPANWRPRADVPITRADCPKNHAACPHVRCRHHLWLIDSSDRPGRRVSPREADGRFMGKAKMVTAYPSAKATPPASILRPATPSACALAVVDRNRAGMRYPEIGRLLGITGERVRQIAVAAWRKLKARLAAAGIEEP